jgi:transcriptional regulator with XRE-family HTH domain
MTFAARLRELREKAGLTQEALARAADMSIGNVRNYEQGIREPYMRGLFRLADALGVSSEAFRDCLKDAAPEPAQAKKGKKK